MDQQELMFDSKAEPSEPTTRIFKVGEVMSAVRLLMERGFSDIWVEGEVSNYRVSPSGHVYFSLKDEKAILKIVLFKGHLSKIKFQIKDGAQLICHGNLSAYEKGGDINLIADGCEPKGVGALQLAFEQLKEKLYKEGLFDPKNKKPLPFLPRKIGIVTSPTGAAIRDILNVLGRRFPDIPILVYPVRVQGEGSAEEVAEAVRYLNTREDIDVMIVGRGGGSLEDLWAFNEEVVARAIFASKIPVISAVGHEIDFTISDFVADKRAPTPSAAAEIVAPRKEDLVKRVADVRKQLARAVFVFVELKEKVLFQSVSRLKPPTSRFPDLLMQIDSLRERLLLAVNRAVEVNGAKLTKLCAELGHLSPLSVLAKGYSVVYKNGAAIRSVTDVRKGEKIVVKMTDGDITAGINEVRRDI